MIEFKLGQIWTYKNRDGESQSRLTILDFSRGMGENKIVHVQLSNVTLRNQTRLPHLALFESALRESVLEITGEDKISEESKALVANWKKRSDGRAFIVPVAKCLQAIELSISRATTALPFDETPNEWCCGLPFIKERPLDAEEKGQIIQRLLRNRRLAAIFLAISFGTLVLPLLVYWALSGEGTLSRVSFGLAMLSCFWVGFTFPKGISEIIKYKTLKKCLDGGVIRRFEGILNLKPLLRFRAIRSLSQYLNDASPEKQSLELLSPSPLVLRANGKFVTSYTRLHVGHASQPGFSNMSARLMRYSSALGSSSEMELRKRHLTPIEKGELRNHCAQITWRASWMGLLRLVIGAACTLGFLLTLNAWTSWQPVEMRKPFLYFPLAIGMAWASQFVWRELRFVHWLRKSEKTGFIIIVDEMDSTSQAPMVEHLPFKKILWTWYGKPANWRTHLSS